MNILFLSLEIFESINDSNIYTDILREFIRNGHKVYSISPTERRYGKKSHIIQEKNSKLLRLKIGNIQKTNLIEKGISTLLIEQQYINAIKKYFNGIKFELILYATPPITFYRVIKYIKNRDNAFAYLMLKDIFPQNAIDLGILKKQGISSVLYKYFRAKEIKLYKQSDKIGCMSQANVNYILKHNSYINPSIVEICPNCIEVTDNYKSANRTTRIKIRYKYDIPQDKIVFIYGGNLGKPQGIDFLIKCLETQSENSNIFFWIIGEGTEYYKIENYINQSKQENVKLMKSVSKKEYDIILNACDVGMIFLDHKFTIPNFPSRMLSYMQASLPILSCTDYNTDIGRIIVNGNFGWWCESTDIKKFKELIDEISKDNLTFKGTNAMIYLKNNYTEKIVYNIIMNGLNKWKKL